MLHHWLEQPHLRGWWGDPERGVSGLAHGLGHDPIDMRIVELHGDPFAYIQDHDVHEWPAPQFSDLPDGARAIDTFLGNAAFLGQGHATGYLKQRARELLAAGAARVAVDPDPENERAIAAYARAGFRGIRICRRADRSRARVMVFLDPG